MVESKESNKQCSEYIELRRKYFMFLFEEYNYEMSHIQKYGAFHNAFYIIGLSAKGLPRLQFLGEIAPGIMIGLPDAPFGEDKEINGH